MSTTETPAEGLEAPETTEDPQVESEDVTEAPEAAEGVSNDDTPEDDMFPREYVEELRREAAEARVKAKRTDDLAARLFVHEVASTGRLADATDLPFAAELLDDPTALDEAITDLLSRKPHLASRTPKGDIGQGFTNEEPEFSLMGLLNSNS